jgi:hypothetical protein
MIIIIIIIIGISIAIKRTMRQLKVRGQAHNVLFAHTSARRAPTKEVYCIQCDIQCMEKTLKLITLLHPGYMLII